MGVHCFLEFRDYISERVGPFVEMEPEFVINRHWIDTFFSMVLISKGGRLNRINHARLLVEHFNDSTELYEELVRSRFLESDGLCIESVAPTASAMSHQYERTRIVSLIYMSVFKGDAIIVRPGTTGKGWKAREDGSGVDYIWED